MPWLRIFVVVALVVLAATFAWEFYCRSIGYVPSLNDNRDLWCRARRKVKPDSLVIIGESRGLFDLDLDELEKGLGQRPIQLSALGACPVPVLADLVNDQSFHGIIICSFVPEFFFAPPNSFIMNFGEKVVKRFHNQTPAQRVGEYVAIVLEEHFAFLKTGELGLGDLLSRLPIPNRPGARVLRSLPGYFGVLDRERRMRLIEKAADPNSDLAKELQGLSLLFPAGARPRGVKPDEWVARTRQILIARFRDTTDAVEKLRARGGQIVFVRLPSSGELKVMEDRVAPRSKRWDPLLQMTQAPGIYYSDYPELSGFNCPDWSHLSASDSVEFSKRLVPHLRAALKMPATP